MLIKKMNKSDLIDNLSNKSDSYSQDDIEKSINSILNLITHSLKNKHRVEVRNFGTFSIRSREERLSRNPKTGTSVLVEAKNHPYFRASKNLKQSLNK
jgi:integration host factor subunit beta|tara:strand:- start:612 stop:905 length:294 start_codon:yes stop_codon:yes gene_type:complete